MGRVFDAMKRHSVADNNGNAAKPEPKKAEHRSESPRVSGLPSAEQVEEQLLAGSTIMSVPHKTVRSSAPTAHTADVPGGSALPGGIASRDAGATLGAAEATPKVAPASREAIPPGSADPPGTSAVCAVGAELRTVL